MAKLMQVKNALRWIPANRKLVAAKEALKKANDHEEPPLNARLERLSDLKTFGVWVMVNHPDVWRAYVSHVFFGGAP